MKAKKLLSLLLAGTLAISAVPMGANAEYVMGDVNQDGVFNNLDIDIITDYYFHKKDYTEEEAVFFRQYADADNDGGVTHNDIRLITQMYIDYDAEAQMGDVNHDGYVDCVDATTILIYYADLSTYRYDEYTEEEHANLKMYGNVYEDEFIDALDVSMIMMIYAENAAQDIE
ncbi:MAG: hypothetical protein K2I06_05845 [Ruminococcus sp.]|nr:hypothetical protein [Ruminococcus sp.]